MPDFRSFARVTDPRPTEIVLAPDESHHLIRVNRARVGDPVVVFNGQGAEWTCECAEADRRAARLIVKSTRRIPTPAATVTLAQALPKGKTFDQIIRKATELRVSRIVPLVSERTEVRLDDARADSKHGKWEATAIEAAKQSGNAHLPEILPIQALDSFLKTADSFDLKLVASLHPGAGSLRPVLQNQAETPQNAVWLIGPEGDFTPDEIAAATTAGFVPITFGPLVLRCDTAAIHALSLLQYEWQNRR